MAASTALPFLGVGPAAAQETSSDAKIRTWRQYSDCRYGQIHLVSAEPADGSGKDKPPLVCLHPSPTSGEVFSEFQAEMAKDRRVICPDTPGYGGSDHPPEKPSIPDLGGAIADALSNLGYGNQGAGNSSLGPCDWLGVHTGCYLVVEIASQRPDLARRLVLPSIPYYPSDQREQQLAQFAVPRPYFSDPDFVGDLFRRRVIDSNSPLDREQRFKTFVASMRSGPNGWWGFDAVVRYDADAALAKITQPVLCPIAEGESLAQPTRDAERLMTGTNSVDVVEMPDVGSFAWNLAPEKISAIIRPFLDAG